MNTLVLHFISGKKINVNSIRFKLTFIYSSVLILSSAILFAGFYWVTQRELYTHTDTILKAHGDQALIFLGKDNLPQGPMSVTSQQLEEIPGMLTFVTDNQGTPTFLSQTLNDQTIVKALFDLYTKSQTSIIENVKVQGISMRFIILPISDHKTLLKVVMVGHPIDVIEQSLQSLTGSLILVFLSLIIPAVLGGFLLAGNALKPIGEIADEMEALSAENLKKRIKNPKTGDEVETLATASNRLLERMEKAFDRERQFMADVAHDLKTPLATVRGSIEIALSQSRTNTEYKKEMVGLLEDTDKLSETLNNLLTVAWSKTDVSQNLLEKVSLSDMGAQLVEIGKKLGNEKQLTFFAHIQEDIVVHGKKDKLFRALLNILENSVKYSRKNGKITLSILHKGNEAHISIKDTGKGIDQKDLPHIFDRYYRGSKTDKTFGSGLGLAIAHAIISAHHGRIEATSRVNHGTAFHIYLPFEPII